MRYMHHQVTWRQLKEGIDSAGFHPSFASGLPGVWQGHATYHLAVKQFLATKQDPALGSAYLACLARNEPKTSSQAAPDNTQPVALGDLTGCKHFTEPDHLPIATTGHQYPIPTRHLVEFVTHPLDIARESFHRLNQQVAGLLDAGCWHR